jgi:hypothetical protein
MAVKITPELRMLIWTQLASEGGKARAEKYDHATLSKWAKLGGRPKKTDAQALQEQSNREASRSKAERK